MKCLLFLEGLESQEVIQNTGTYMLKAKRLLTAKDLDEF